MYGYFFRLSNIGRLDGDNERLALVGREDDRLIVNHKLSLAQLQRRVRMLENELIDSQRSQSMWRLFLLAMTVLNPLFISYFMRRR